MEKTDELECLIATKNRLLKSNEKYAALYAGKVHSANARLVYFLATAFNEDYTKSKSFSFCFWVPSKILYECNTEWGCNSKTFKDFVLKKIDEEIKKY